MKKIILTIATVLGALGLTQMGTASVNDEIAKRLEPVGKVCLKGEDCASASAAAGAVATAGGGEMKPAEEIYSSACSTCHAIGVAGAPKFADTAAWAPRIDKGMETLYDSVVNGLAPGMPAKGMCFTCSDEELKSVTDYMVAAAEE